jgi:isocitrate/isopropylmalate dehydrogenase
MKTYKIAVIPRPGIGNKVVPEAVRLLESTDLEFDFSYMEIGYEEMCCKTQKCSIF